MEQIFLVYGRLEERIFFYFNFFLFQKSYFIVFIYLFD